MKPDEQNKKQFKQKDQKFTSKNFTKPKVSEKLNYQYDYFVEGMENFNKWGSCEY